MTPDKYKDLRDELVKLLKRAVLLDSVNLDTRERLSRICRKALENQFEIVLAGEFQGGKSTTFNAFCDGRELSPSGSGIKTSGCIVSARNISDPAEEESARVEWRTQQELVIGFSDLLLPHLQTLYPDRFEKTNADDLKDLINLENSQDRKIIAEAVDQEWQVFARNKAGYDLEQKGFLDILRAAAIIVRYYNDEVIKKFRTKKKFSPEEIGRLIVFPADWEERWIKKNPDRFDPEEILFVFIRRVDVKIHSRNLGRLGCVMVDCPGLFASRWDTEVARKAMFDADAILYMFDGSRTMKLSDLKALQFIRQNGMEYKLFYGCNMRSHTLNDSLRIMNSSITQLKNKGFAIEDSDFTMFHALLSLRSIQLQRFKKGRLDTFTQQRIIQGNGGSDVNKKLEKVINRQMAILDADEDADAAQNIKDTTAWVRQVSGLDRLMIMADQRVIRKKARSILIDNGSQLAANCLLEAEGSLKSRENIANRREKEFRDQVNMVEKELEKFKIDSVRAISRLDEKGPDHWLADDIWERLDARKDDLCETVTRRIYKDAIKSNKVSILLFNRKKLKDQITGIIREEIDSAFKETINSWVVEIKDGRNKVYQDRVVSKIQSVGRELKEIWDRSALPEINLLSGIGIPEFSGNLEFDNEKIFKELEESQLFDNVRYNILVAAGSLTGIVTASSGLLVAIFVLISRLMWMAIASAVVVLINIIIIFLTRGVIKDSMMDEIRNKLEPAFTTLFYEIRDDVKKEFRRFSANIRQLYKHVFLAAVNKPRQIFEERRQQVEADLKKSRKERLEIAEQARRIREEQIKPLRMNLQAFVARVEHSLAREVEVKPEQKHDDTEFENMEFENTEFENIEPEHAHDYLSADASNIDIRMGNS